MSRLLAQATGLVLLHGLLLGQQPFHWQIQPPPPAPVGGAVEAVATFDATAQRALWLITQFPVEHTIEWGPGGWIDHGATPLLIPGLVTTASAIAHDPVGHETLLFGGFTYPVIGDLTWTWTGSAWLQLSPAHRPSPRREAGLFFDEVRQHLILVAGTANNGTSPWTPSLDHADTWEWNGGDWVPLAPAHQPTAGPCRVAYDSLRGRAVLLPVLGNSMWEWDGSDWSEVLPTQMPPLTWNGGMTFDASRGRTLLQAGATWEWDGVDWRPLTAVDALAWLPIVFDAAAQRSILVGRYGTAAVWLSTNAVAQHVASAVPYGSGCGSPELRLEPLSLPVLGMAAQVQVTPLPLSVAGVTTAWISAGFNQASGFAWPTPDCAWHHTSEIVGLSCTPNGRWALTVPYDTSLLDFDLYLQGVAFAPGQNSASLVLSNGVHWRLGDS